MDFLSKFKIKNNYLAVFLLGLLTSFLIFLPFLIMDKGYFLYYGDFDVQQIPFYRLAHDAIQNGEFFWNWNTDLGANFIGSYSFYLLGSPFFWLTLAFPSQAVPFLMAPLLMLKFAFTGLTAFAYINRFTKTSQTAIVGALMYAFCGFNVYNVFFNHFNEVVLFFPLLLVSLEELMINNRRGWFAICVAICCFINYYFFFGQVIFVIFYFAFRCSSKDFRASVKKFFLVALEAVMGVLIAGILLLPSIFAILGNPRLDSSLTGMDMLVYGNAQRYGLIFSSFFFPPDIPARPNFFPDSNAKWSSVSMFLPLLSTVGVFAFFRGAKKHWAKKLLAVCFVICFIPFLNSAFSAFNYSYYARWFYMPLLIMAMISCLSLENHRKHLKFGVIWTSVFIGGFALIGILPQKINGKLKFFQMPEYIDRFWAYVALAVMGILLTTLLYVLTRKHKHFIKVAVSGVMTVSILMSIFMIYTGKLAGNGYNVIVEQALKGSENLALSEEQFYRIDTYGELDNLGMYWKIPTINAFHSVVPSSIMEYYESVGEERGVASRPKTNKIGIRALTSVKYSFVHEDKSNENKKMLGFEYYDTQNGYVIYENNYFIPMGFTYDYLITQNQFRHISSEYRDRLLLKGLLLEDEDYETYKELLPTLNNDDSYDSVLREDSDYYKSCKRLAGNAGYSFTYDSKGFTSKINSDEKSLMFFSVPYDEGWSATVNDNAVEILKANNGFMAVPIPAGGSVVHFEYHTPGLPFGLIATITGIIMLVSYLVIVYQLRKKYPKKYFYDRYAHLRNQNGSTEILAEEAYIQKVSSHKEKKE